MGKSSINGGFSIAIDYQRAHIISYNLTYNHIAQVETTSKNDNASKLRFRRDSGCCHKTYGSLEVISGYSQSSQRKKGSQQQNEHRIVKLTYNHLSLHNQALSQSLETNFQSNAAHTGPPMAMRESRTGLSQRTDGGNQLLKPKLQSIDSTKIGPKRKCRSNIALLRRQINRARNRNMHRRTYRRLKTQALAFGQAGATVQGPRSNGQS